ncbi:hypothetical protein V496_01136 [Pseudogymnoascus sp. VKM F-4515 (FW-2607)]|nr:hypothetical protein V496_01136 [Pseudogymnoascus sp. VKM F-4515 (FW-2607)]
MNRFRQHPRLTQIRFLRSTAILKGRLANHGQDSNTDTKSHDAQCEVVVERSTEEVRTWKEKLATESEADVKADRGETEAGRKGNADKSRIERSG